MLRREGTAEFMRLRGRACAWMEGCSAARLMVAARAACARAGVPRGQGREIEHPTTTLTHPETARFPPNSLPDRFRPLFTLLFTETPRRHFGELTTSECVYNSL